LWTTYRSAQVAAAIKSMPQMKRWASALLEYLIVIVHLSAIAVSQYNNYMVIHVFIKFWHHDKGMQTDTSWLTGCCYALENMQWRILYLTDLRQWSPRSFNSCTMGWIVNSVFLICFVFVTHTIGNSLTQNFTSYMHTSYMHLVSLSSPPPPLISGIFSHNSFSHFCVIPYCLFSVFSSRIPYPCFYPYALVPASIHDTPSFSFTLPLLCVNAALIAALV